MSKPAAYERDEKILDLLDGNLPEYEQADLRDWLNLSPTHWERFAKLSFLHTQIAHQLNSQFTSDGVRLSALQAEPIQAEQPPIHLNASSALTRQQYIFALKYVLKHTFTPKRIAVFATAAAVLLGLVLTIGLMTGPDETDTQPIANAPQPTIPSNEPPTIKPTVATLTNTHNAKWSSPQAEGASAPGSHLSVGSPLHPNQRLTLTQGFAEITTNDGAIAILQAPATIELLDSDNALQLDSGKLVGICETDSSRGFVVKTDHATITDIGTEFGVHAHANGTDTTVFVGEVEVDTPGRPPQRITTNQTARVSTAKAQPSIVIEDKPTAGFARRLPRAPLVTNASINLDGFTVQVLPNGVYEDAKLFSDRDHELNGIDEAGLPAFLIGGDLVRMPADARPDKMPTVGDTLQLTLELSAPCDIYVLIPEKGKAGDWLERDYENTGLFVGNDMSGRAGGNPEPYEGGVGPGSSIDEPLAIWKRKQPVSGRAVVTGTIADSMYAVIAVPYQTDNHHDSP